MDAPLLTADFREFLSVLNAHRVDYLLVGGYAVGSDPLSIVRFGLPPFRIEVMTSIDGVEFAPCRARALSCDLDGVTVPVISLADLKVNKRAAGRHKDLADLDNLP